MPPLPAGGGALPLRRAANKSESSRWADLLARRWPPSVRLRRGPCVSAACRTCTGPVPRSRGRSARHCRTRSSGSSRLAVYRGAPAWRIPKPYLATAHIGRMSWGFADRAHSRPETGTRRQTFSAPCSSPSQCSGIERIRRSSWLQEGRGQAKLPGSYS